MFAEATGEEIDIDHVELQLKFALELQGLKESRSAQLGYVLIDREGLSNVAIVFSTPVKAAQALDNHPTIRDLIGDGYLTIYVPDHVDLALLAGRDHSALASLPTSSPAHRNNE